MQLWTFQSIDAYRVLQKDGRLICDITQSNFADLPEFVRAYNWMAEQMALRIPKPEDATYPIWAWKRWGGHEKCPDIRITDFKYRNTDEVLLTLDVPDSLVLLSDFDLWHNVLNNSIITSDDVEFDYFYEKADEWEKCEMQKRTWPLIFSTQGEYLQACLWELKIEWVQGIKLCHANPYPQIL